MRINRRTIAALIFTSGLGCSSEAGDPDGGSLLAGEREGEVGEGEGEAQVGEGEGEGQGEGEDSRFAAGVMPSSLHDGGYIDSPFINKRGDRIYFLHSVFSPSVLDGRFSPEQCSHVEGAQLPGHVTAEGLEWNTDIYYVEWDGVLWSEPVNLGAPINSLGMECCMWLNDDETEIIFNTVSDLDGDGVDGDIGLAPTGNYMARRADRDAPWGAPTPLPGDYGVDGQGLGAYRHDMHKAPSGNLYFWERFANGDQLLRFGERSGGADDEPVYASPVTIRGSTNFDTQVWANDQETRLVFNHRQPDGESELHTRARATGAEPWGDAVTVETVGFADAAGRSIWGEPGFDQSERFMIFVRFNTTDGDCWTPDLMYSAGDVSAGFGPPRSLN